MAYNKDNGGVIETPPLLKNLFLDLGNEPEWRGKAAMCMAWRDNHPWTKAQKEYFKSLGIPEDLFVNLVAPAMDAVKGHEAKNRTDWMLSASDSGDDELVEGLNHKFNDEMRLADANDACSDAYASQADVGIGWVHVEKNQDIFHPAKLSITNTHRDEMSWDMRSFSNSLRHDCRWMSRRRFLDEDEAIAFFPKHKELIQFSWSDYATMDIGDSETMARWRLELEKYTDNAESFLENTGRKRKAIYEVYYKIFEERNVIASDDGAVQEFKADNPIHQELLATGMAQLHTKVSIPVLREAWFIGPHCVFDGPTRHPHNFFPYVPFFDVREDATRTPVGRIRRMLGPQEEYNRAAVEIQNLLGQVTIIMDEFATPRMTDPQVVLESRRKSGLIKLRHGHKFEIVRQFEKIAVLEGICKRAKEEISQASGIFQTFQGDTEKQQSGIAVENIASLGEQTLGKLNANYQGARKNVGELAFYHILEDVGVTRTTVNIPQSLGQDKKTVVINDGPNNRASMFRGRVALLDVHTSSGYKNHTNQRIEGIIGKMPDDLKATFVPLWLETADMPNKDFALKLFYEKIGYTDNEQEREKQDQDAAQQQEESRQLETRQILADIAVKEADAEQKKSEAAERLASAEKDKAEAGRKRAETVQILQEIKLAKNGKVPADPRKPAPSDAPERIDNSIGSAMPVPPQQAVVNPALA